MAADIGRRQLVIGGSAVLATPALASAQARPRRLATLGSGRVGASSPFLDAFREGLRDLGWEDGRNLAVTSFWSEGPREQAEDVARQAIASRPDLIFVYGPDVLPLHRVKPTIPVVFGFSGDPTDAGLVKSFARPGGNFTGISLMSLELAAKRIEFLRDAVPSIRRLGVLARPEHPGEHRERAVSEDAARQLGLTLAYVPIQQASGLDGALQAVARERCDSMVVFPDAVMLASSDPIAAFATQMRMPTVSGWSGFADHGLLMTFGPNLHASYRALARHADRILRGARPEDLPVELPRSVELVLNARTARALGITLPEAVRLRADRVID